MLFPVGTRLSNAAGIFRKYEWDTKYGDSSHNVPQKEYFTHTPGHNDRLISYVAIPAKGLPRAPTYEYTEACSQEMLSAFQRNLSEPLTGPNGEIRFLTAHGGDETVWELAPKLPDQLQTAYWIVSVPKEVMRDHGDIFNENALAMMARLFRVSNPRSEPGFITSAGPRTMRLVEPSEKPAPSPSGAKHEH